MRQRPKIRPPTVNPSPNVPSAKAPTAIDLRQSESRCQRPIGLFLLRGEGLAAPLLAHGATRSQPEVDVVEELWRLVRHVSSV